MTYIPCSNLEFLILYRQLCELYVSDLSPSGWLSMTCMGKGLLLDNCCYDVTEDCSKAFNRNATIVPCRSERVKICIFTGVGLLYRETVNIKDVSNLKIHIFVKYFY